MTLQRAMQALMNDLRILDSFNWGYDPFHYTVPEGKLRNGSKRFSVTILEFRQMVKITTLELKLIMDVVYSHTSIW
ncbi:hypothetical protein OK016_26165 [Vibrio chagasii]|nr:hypothetical protein [Vibrio chagasii]